MRTKHPRRSHNSPRYKSSLFGIVLLSVSTVTIVTAYSASAPRDANLWSQFLPQNVRQVAEGDSSSDLSDGSAGLAEVSPLTTPAPLAPLDAETPQEKLSKETDNQSEPSDAPQVAQPKAAQPQVPSPVPEFEDPFERSRTDALNQWFQVAALDIDVPEIPRTHAYFMDDQSVFTGRISVMGNSALVPSSVTFSQNGNVVREVPLGPDGRFSIRSLPPGPYGLHVDNEATQMTFGVYLSTTDDLREAGYNESQIQDALQAQRRSPIWLNSLSSSPSDIEAVQQFFADYRYDYPEKSDRTVSRRILDVPRKINFKVSAQGTTIHDHVVRLHDNGNLYGRIRRFTTLSNKKNAIVPAAAVEVAFIRNGRLVATTITDTHGTFVTRELTEGNYTLAAKSPAGIAVFSFTAKKLPPVTAKEEVKTSSVNPFDDGLQKVSLLQEEEPEAKVAQFIPGPNGTELLIDAVLTIPPEIPGTVFATGGGGAVGGVAGGAGGGGALGGLLLGAGAGALIPDDDDDPNPEDPEVTPDAP